MVTSGIPGFNRIEAAAHAVRRSREIIVDHKIQLDKKSTSLLRGALWRLRFKEEGLLGAVKSLDQSPSTATLDKVRSTLKATEESVAEAADLIEAVARRMDAAYRKYGGPGSRAQFFELSRRLLDILALKLDRSYAKSAKRNLREGVRQTLQGMVDTLEAAVKKGEIGSVRTFASDILETFQQFNKEVDALDERIKEVHRLKSITFTGVRLLLIWLGVIAGLAVFVYMNYDRIAALTEFLLSIL